MIRQIVAMDTQRGIATGSGIPWRLAGDVEYFRQQTSSGVIVMGRATYAEFKTPLHDRTNLVLTSSPEDLRDGFRPIAGLAEGIGAYPGEDIWVIGGAGVYASTISVTDELLITQVLADFGCTKFFPHYIDAFAIVNQSDKYREGDISYRFETWRRA